jgi:hypothetical protein
MAWGLLIKISITGWSSADDLRSTVLLNLREGQIRGGEMMNFKLDFEMSGKLQKLITLKWEWWWEGMLEGMVWRREFREATEKTSEKTSESLQGSGGEVLRSNWIAEIEVGSRGIRLES